ncbi:MAG: hypothetical protein ABR961_08420 [Thermoanaerobaculaceae bacterium]
MDRKRNERHPSMPRLRAVATPACALHRPRRPQTTPLCRLVEADYTHVRNGHQLGR